jgi:hypothetical protein
MAEHTLRFPGIVANHRGVVVKNMVSRYVVPWQQLNRIDLGVAQRDWADEAISHRLELVTQDGRSIKCGSLGFPTQKNGNPDEKLDVMRRELLQMRDDALSAGYQGDRLSGPVNVERYGAAGVWERLPASVQGTLVVVGFLALLAGCVLQVIYGGPFPPR